MMKVPMPEPTGPDADDALRAMLKILARQAAALDLLFYSAAMEAMSDDRRCHRNMHRALKAQNLCRQALNVVVALRAMIKRKKNSPIRTSKLLAAEIPAHDQQLAKPVQTAFLRSGRTKSPPKPWRRRTEGEISRNKLTTQAIPWAADCAYSGPNTASRTPKEDIDAEGSIETGDLRGCAHAFRLLGKRQRQGDQRDPEPDGRLGREAWPGWLGRRGARRGHEPQRRPGRGRLCEAPQRGPPADRHGHQQGWGRVRGRQFALWP